MVIDSVTRYLFIHQVCVKGLPLLLLLLSFVCLFVVVCLFVIVYLCVVVRLFVVDDVL